MRSAGLPALCLGAQPQANPKLPKTGKWASPKYKDVVLNTSLIDFLSFSFERTPT